MGLQHVRSSEQLHPPCQAEARCNIILLTFKKAPICCVVVGEFPRTNPEQKNKVTMHRAPESLWQPSSVKHVEGTGGTFS